MKLDAYFRRLGIKQNLFLLSGAISLIYLTVGAMSLHSLMVFGRRYNELKDNNLQATRILHDVDNAFLKLRLSSSNYGVGKSVSRAQVDAFDTELKKKIDESLKRFAPMVDTPEETEYVRQWGLLYPEYLELRSQQMKLLEAGREKEFNDFRVQVIIPLNKKTEQTLEGLIAFQTAEAAKKELSVANDVQQSQLVITLLLISSGVLGATLISLSVNWLSREEQHRAEALNKSATLGAISGDLAHEINNPLAVITASVDLLDMMGEGGSFEPVRAKRMIDKIRVGADRIQKVTSGMRAFARDGSADPFVPFELRRMLEETAAFCADKMKRHSVAFYLDCPEQEFQIEGRAAELSQVIVNLLGNSVDAISEMNDRWLRLTVRDLGEELEIAILDSGRGIPAAVRDKMFKTSFTTKAVGAGTGLGLGICARIIGTHHGTIAVDAGSPNTRIVITLPKTQVAFAEPKAS